MDDDPADQPVRVTARRGAAIALGVATIGWVVAATFLLRTSVPGNLHFRHIDSAATFGANTVRRAAHYERFGNWDWLASQAATVGVLILYAKRGAVFARQSAAGPIGTGMLLGMLGLALVWLSNLPFGIAQHWWDRRHHVSSEGYIAWATGDWAQLGAAFLSICLALVIVMAIAQKLPRTWWLPGALVFVAIGTGF